MVADSATYAAKSAVEPQRNTLVDKGVAAGGNVSFAHGNSESASMPSTPPAIADAVRRLQTNGQTRMDAPKNKATAAAVSKPSVSAPVPADSEAAMSKSAADIIPPLSVAQPKSASINVRASKRAVAHSAAAKSKRGQMKASDILLIVGDVEQSRVALEQTVKSAGGTIMGTKDVTYEDRTQAAMLTLDVPTAQVPALLSELDALGQREPFDNTTDKGKTQFRASSGVSAGSINIMPNKTENYVDNSGTPGQAQPAVRVPSRARTSPDASAPSYTPAGAEPKSSAAFGLSSAHARITIHLQEKPRR